MPFMGITDITLFVIAFLILLILPGPGNLALLTATSKSGVRAGIITLFGVMLGDQVLLWLATGGVAALLFSYPAAFKLMQWIGAAYLAFLGLSLLWPKAAGNKAFSFKQGNYFVQGFLLTLLNPKAVMFYMAFFPQFIDADNHLGFITLLVMAATVATICFIYGVVFCLLTKVLAKPFQRHPKIASGFEKLAGLSLIYFAITMMR